MLSASRNDDKIAWYENDGSGNFSSEVIISTNADGAISVFSQDLDGDGDFDVLSASFWDDKIALYENLHGEGCTDQEACNFDPSAWIDDGSCCFGVCGCIDTGAVNFNPAAACDDLGCQYLLQGHVFDDLDEDGVWDTNEYAVAYRTVVIPFLGLTLITNDEGMFQTTVGAGGFYVVVGHDLLLPYNTTPQEVQVSFPQDAGQLIEFGLSKEVPSFAVCVDFYPSGGSFLCNDFANHNICYRNMGNVPIDGIVEVEYDPLFQGYNEVTPIDSTDGNIL